MRIAFIGATGLIGRQLLPLLDADHDVLVLGRRPSGAAREKLGPVERWPALLEGEQVDVAVSTLGTTWKKAGSWEAFAAVDHHGVVGFAHAVKAAGARQMISVSSVGADPASRNGYLALKGRVERDLQEIGFERLDIFQPGLLIGDRGQDRRVLERLGILVSPVVNLALRGRLDRYAAIPAVDVARAIAKIAGTPGGGVHVHQNRGIRSLLSRA